MNEFPVEILHLMCPMHAVLDRTGHICQAGPTLHKLTQSPMEGARFLEIFEVHRPHGVTSMSELLATTGRKLHLRMRSGVRTPLKGILVADGRGGAVVNLSFGISVVDAVRDYALTSTDFAPTDLAVEMLYLVEAKSALIDESRSLNTRLQGAMVAAEERAFTDTLTGLGNRRAMDTVLEKLCRSSQGFALLHLDLDLFKQVNDTMGHAAGDQVLRHVARVMLDETRQEDSVARVGGDEFVILLNRLTLQDRLADLSRRLITRIEEPVMHEGQPCHVSASIGITIAKGGAKPAELLEQADLALYASKRAGRAQHQFFSAEMENVSKAPIERAVGI